MIYPLEVEDAPHLFALDLGLRFGWALYTQKPSLIAYGNQRCGAPTQLKTLAYKALSRLPQGSHVVVEGGGPLLKLWRRPAERHALIFRSYHAERWRHETLSVKVMSGQVKGSEAKKEAIIKAKRVIDLCGRRKPTPLRDDAAEAILLGWWSLYQMEWCPIGRFREGLG